MSDEIATIGDRLPPSVERERARARLRSVWKLVESGRPSYYTSIVIPSLSFDVDELAKIRGASFYEERLLFTLIRLRDPRAHVVYITSEPIHPEIIAYYLDLLRGVSTRDAMSRLKVLALYDSAPTPLTRKILDRPRVVGRLRDLAHQTRHAYLTCFNTSPLEAELAGALDVPLNAVEPELLWLGTKSGSRKVFAAAGIESARGYEDLSSRRDVVEALVELARRIPELRRAVIKLDESFAGAGNAVFRYPRDSAGRLDSGAVDAALEDMELAGNDETPDSYFAKMSSMGGIVEELVEADGMRSPSAQLRIGPEGDIELLSTHDQILGGPSNQTYLGCRFPAAPSYRKEIGELGRRVGAVLRDHGVVSRFGVDFLAYRDGSGGLRLPAIEINLRMGGTTGPFLALQYLTSGQLDPEIGVFRSLGGTEKYYTATDNLNSAAYKGLLAEDFIDILARSRVGFDATTETGAVFHMIGALSEFGKIGVTTIGDTPDQANAIYHDVVSLLDQAGQADLPARGSRTPHPFDIAIRSIE